MPNYDYLCTKCGTSFEKMVPLADYAKSQPCTKCPYEAGRITKGTSGIAFKGTGWTPKFY